MENEQVNTEHSQYWTTNIEDAELKCLFQNNNFQRVIDVGCGVGTLLYNLQKNGFLNNSDEVWGTDLSIVKLGEIKKFSNKIITVQDDAQELSKLPDNYFDIVITTDVIEHMKDDTAMLKSMYRICRPSGIIYIKTVYKNNYAWYYYKNEYGERVLGPTHEREYKADSELHDRIKLLGLKLICSNKMSHQVPLIDFFVNRIPLKDPPSFYERHPFLKILRKIRVSIPGYYAWKLILVK